MYSSSSGERLIRKAKGFKKWAYSKLTFRRREKQLEKVCKQHLLDPLLPRILGNGMCPCIGLNTSGVIYPLTDAGEGNVSYPRSVGSFCAAWDSDRHPSCKGNGNSSDPSCESEWCYVDPLMCTIPALPVRSKLQLGATYQRAPLYLSYSTCDAEPTREEVIVSDLGMPSCRCIGFEKWPGTAALTAGNVTLTYPKEVGSHCDAWDLDHHPECHGQNAPIWCRERWCYVDPCSCAIGKPPARSAALPNATFQKQPVHYSYATCGGKDHYNPYSTKDAQDKAWDVMARMCT
jgi:hypothetical protein